MSVWKIENNVCNQGETSIETLLISGCKEDQFTCDDGKCLSINQRCNNIEVSFFKLILFFIQKPNKAKTIFLLSIIPLPRIELFFLILSHKFKDCDDVSDEKNCKTIAIDPEKYLKSKPPPSADVNSKLPITLRY